MTPTVTEDEVAELAQAMSWKLGCHGMPVGGAKAGIRVDPKSREAPELIGYFARGIAAELAHDTVIGKDMGATDELLDELYAQAGVQQLGIVGVPGVDRLRDLPGYVPHMTGRGVTFAISAGLGQRDLSGVRVAIQGAGLVGLGTAYRVMKRGATVVAMSDKDRTVFWKDGVPIENLLEWASSTRDLSRVPTASAGKTEKLFDAEADVVVLAAASYSVKPEMVERIRASLLVEGANMAFTPEARERVDKWPISLVPDVIASSSSAAMVCIQMAEGGQVESAELWRRIEDGIHEAWSVASKRALDLGVSVREAHIQRCKE